MGLKKIVIITAKVHDYLLSALEEKGFTVSYVPQVSYDELNAMVSAAEGLIVTTRLSIDKTVLDNAVNLKWIGRLGSGMELIDVAYAESRGVKCVSSPEGNRQAVAEHTLGMVLGLLHKINSSFTEIKNGKWIREANRGKELSGKTVGIIGLGNTGNAFAGLLSSFGVTVLAYDKYKFGFSYQHIKESSLAEISANADVISFHVPLSVSTQQMADEFFFNSLQQKPIIINTSRGGVIKTAALIKALQQNLVSGIALDVLENEHLDNLSAVEKKELDLLSQHPAVLLTPHIAGYSAEAFYKMSVVILEKLEI